MTNIYSINLPNPMSYKSDWPWDKRSKKNTKIFNNNTLWPKISIVTPSFNQGQFLEETLRSVILQEYPNLEYIVIDGGSTDNSIEIIKKYEKWLSHWVSETDNGQANAINKGFELSTGELLAWINSDDILKPNSLFKVANIFKMLKGPNWLIGGCETINSTNQKLNDRYPVNEMNLEKALDWRNNYFFQPSVFWNTEIWQLVKPLDSNLHITLDYDLWLKMFKIIKPIQVDKVLSCNRTHKDTKTSNNTLLNFNELKCVVLKHFKNNKKYREIAFQSISNHAINIANFKSIDSLISLKIIYFALNVNPKLYLSHETYKTIIKNILYK